jgi:hypothetical protein
MMWDGNGYWSGGAGREGWVMFVFMIVFVIAVIVGIVFLVRYLALGCAGTYQSPRAQSRGTGPLDLGGTVPPSLSPHFALPLSLGDSRFVICTRSDEHASSRILLTPRGYWNGCTQKGVRPVR